MPRCKNCKVKFTPKFFLQKYCDADICQSVMITEAREKVVKEKIKSWKPNTHAKENKKDLQDEINKLSRMIDVAYGNNTCIDCGLILDKEKNQIDAAHFISRGSNCTLRYNMHNLHSAHNHCNVWNEKHETNYKKGLINRYGFEYLNMVEELPLKYKEIHLSNVEVAEKLKLVRLLIRTFGTYKFESAIQARNIFNNLIGIYT